MKQKRNIPMIFETNLFYLVIALLFLGVAPIVQSRNIYSGLVITEYLIILLPTVGYLALRGYNLKTVLRLNRLSLKQILLIPPIVVLAYPVGAFFNAVANVVLSLFGELIPPPIPTPQSGDAFLLGLFVIALSPGICEEVMFRGLMMKGYEKKGVKKAIVISGILFGIFHFNPQNLLGPIFLGILFGYMVYKTNSIYASIIAHTTNNGLAWTLSYIFAKANIDTEAGSELVSQMPYTMTLALGALMVGVIALVTGSVGFLLLRALPKSGDSLLGVTRQSTLDTSPLEKGIIKYIPLILVLGAFAFLSMRMLQLMGS